MNYNIIIDGNYLFHKTKSMFLAYGKHATLFDGLSTNELKAEFFRKVLIDLSHTVNNFKDYDKVVMVFDESSSWRKDFYPEYKKKEPIEDEDEIEGWKQFYSVMETFKKHVSKKGIIVSSIPKFEGDDLLYFWSNHFKKQGQKSIIVTGDRDMVQLVDEHVTVFCNNSKDLKFFHTSDFYKETLSKEFKYEEETVDNRIFIINKVLKGDSGDNVPNAYKGMGPKAIEKIIEMCANLEFLDARFNDPDYTSAISLICENVIKNSKSHEIKKNIDRNVKLMVLDNYIYTSEQIDLIQKELKENNIYSFNEQYSLSNLLEK